MSSIGSSESNTQLLDLKSLQLARSTYKAPSPSHEPIDSGSSNDSFMRDLMLSKPATDLRQSRIAKRKGTSRSGEPPRKLRKARGPISYGRLSASATPDLTELRLSSQRSISSTQGVSQHSLSTLPASEIATLLTLPGFMGQLVQVRPVRLYAQSNQKIFGFVVSISDGFAGINVTRQSSSTIFEALSALSISSSGYWIGTLYRFRLKVDQLSGSPAVSTSLVHTLHRRYISMWKTSTNYFDVLVE